MKNISGVILLCCSAWMAIYLYGEYAINSSRYHSFLVVFPVVLFILAIKMLFTSAEVDQKKSNKRSNKLID